MDNQQERSNFNKGWLAGVIDSDGCLQLVKQTYKKRNGSGEKTCHYRPQIVFHNTNLVYMTHVAYILRKHNIAFYVEDRNEYKNFGTRDKRPYVRITIYGFKRCKKFFDNTGIQLIGKAVQQKIMLDYIDYRLSLKYGSPVTEKDVEYYEKMKKANHQFKGEIPRDYTPYRDNQTRKI